MKDGFDMVVDVFSLINISEITSQVDNVHLNFRPSGRESFKDIVINSMGIDNDQIQSGFGNINIYVPPILQYGKQVANQVELKRLIGIITPLIDGIHKTSFGVRVSEPGKIRQNEDSTHYANIKFKYTSVQENYKHV